MFVASPRCNNAMYIPTEIIELAITRYASEMISSGCQSMIMVSVAIATGKRTTKPTIYCTKPPIMGSVFISCHFSKSVATVIPMSALNARKTATQGLGPSELPDIVTRATPINPIIRPAQRYRPPRLPMMLGPSAATSIG